MTGKRADLLDRLVRVLSYFVRCGAVLQRHEERPSSDIDNQRLLMPFLSPLHQHRRELSMSTIKPSVSLSTLTEPKNMNSSSTTLVPTADSSSRSGMHRTSSCLSQLTNENVMETSTCSSSSLYPSLADAHSDLDVISEKVSKLCRVPTEAIIYHLKSIGSQRDTKRSKISSERQMAAIDNINYPHKSTVQVFDHNTSKSEAEHAEDVIFVLGENEKLVGIKQGTTIKDEISNNSNDMDNSDELPEIVIENSAENIRETSLYLKSYHSVRFHSDRCDEGEDCCLMLGGAREGGKCRETPGELLEEPLLVIDTDDEEDEEIRGPQLVELTFPTSSTTKPASSANTFASSLIGCASEHYISDMVVQACTQDSSMWKHKLRRDLTLAAHQPLFDKEVAEAVCVLANTDTW